MVGATELSTWAFDVQISDEKEKLEVSGFSATGAREYVPGTAEQEVEVSFRQDYASGRAASNDLSALLRRLGVQVLGAA